MPIDLEWGLTWWIHSSWMLECLSRHSCGGHGNSSTDSQSYPLDSMSGFDLRDMDIPTGLVYCPALAVVIKHRAAP